jgi:hypothetical protein
MTPSPITLYEEETVTEEESIAESISALQEGGLIPVDGKF